MDRHEVLENFQFHNDDDSCLFRSFNLMLFFKNKACNLTKSKSKKNDKILVWFLNFFSKRQDQVE